MGIISQLVDISNNGMPSTEYIETELKNRGIDPLRWAIVKITDESYTIDVAFVACED